MSVRKIKLASGSKAWQARVIVDGVRCSALAASHEVRKRPRRPRPTCGTPCTTRRRRPTPSRAVPALSVTVCRDYVGV